MYGARYFLLKENKNSNFTTGFVVLMCQR